MIILVFVLLTLCFVTGVIIGTLWDYGAAGFRALMFNGKPIVKDDTIPSGVAYMRSDANFAPHTEVVELPYDTVIKRTTYAPFKSETQDSNVEVGAVRRPSLEDIERASRPRWEKDAEEEMEKTLDNIDWED